MHTAYKTPFSHGPPSVRSSSSTFLVLLTQMHLDLDPSPEQGIGLDGLRGPLGLHDTMWSIILSY